MTVSDIFSYIDSLAPFASQADFDNSGLLVGSPDREVHAVLFALDVTDRVLDEAEKLGADLLITHHPLMFSPIHTLREDDYEGALLCRMIRLGLSLIACHTPLDQAPGGTNDTLASLCRLSNIRGEGYIRVGELPAPVSAGLFRITLQNLLGDAVRLMGDPAAVIHTLGLCTGAGSGEWPDAVSLGADAFLTGEVKHNKALEMAARGVPVFECGHFATEQPGIFALADTLQKWLDAVQCNVSVYKSKAGAYAFPVSYIS